MAAPDTKKYQGLITTGIVTGALLLLFIAGSAAILSIAAKTRKVSQTLQQEMYNAQQQANQGEEVIDYSMVYTRKTLEERETLNDNETYNVTQKLNAPPRPDALNKLNEFTAETDRICNMLHEFRYNLSDTLTMTGDYGNSSLTAAYFNTDNRQDYILNELKQYRNRSVQNAASTTNNYLSSDPNSTLPLDDIPSTNATGVWNPSKFYDTPENAMQYLLELEIAVRYFEYDVLMVYNQ
ncbi:MAG: hypothetical protein MUC87_14730 [Bacteroidia bacterium]|jgi:hypothetical protein|nr:hypothetical protein [Bacteroidia bacterium]